MPDDLYDRDILIWSEQQADLLRRLAAGERVNEAVDWPNLIEEVQDVGLSELRACRSLLRQAMTHLLKMRLFPDGPQDHWRDEVVELLTQATDAYTPSMGQRIDLGDQYRRALNAVKAGGATDLTGLATDCPFALDDLLADPPDMPGLLATLGQSFDARRSV